MGREEGGKAGDEGDFEGEEKGEEEITKKGHKGRGIEERLGAVRSEEERSDEISTDTQIRKFVLCLFPSVAHCESAKRARITPDLFALLPEL